MEMNGKSIVQLSSSIGHESWKRYFSSYYENTAFRQAVVAREFTPVEMPKPATDVVVCDRVKHFDVDAALVQILSAVITLARGIACVSPRTGLPILGRME